MLQISGIWADVMRMGVQPHVNQDDAEWWIEHQKEIKFAFGVLAGLGLANQGETLEDGTIAWSPSRLMKRIHREWQFYRYRHARDERLQAIVALKNPCFQPSSSD